MPDLDTITEYLKNYDGEEKVIMEVCGTHTAAISENGIPSLLSDKIKLISGPGCPVCVTVAAYIDKLIEISLRDNTTVVTFGDMIRVKGSDKSLRDAAAAGGSVRMVYSPFEIIDIAKTDEKRQFVFAAVGFETTTPIYALLIEQLLSEGVDNVKFLTALKTMPQAIRAIVNGDTKIAGFLAPGHVSAITGYGEYKALAKELKLPFVVAGFKGGELLGAIYALTKLKKGESLNMYPSVVTTEGNVMAKAMVNKYLTPCDAAWRGMGIIPMSGMRIKDEYSRFDAGSMELVKDKMYNAACGCGEVISGRKSPHECQLFGKVCTPDTPQGACMVSMEGSCFHYYTNNR